MISPSTSNHAKNCHMHDSLMKLSLTLHGFRGKKASYYLDDFIQKRSMWCSAVPILHNVTSDSRAREIMRLLWPIYPMC